MGRVNKQASPMNAIMMTRPSALPFALLSGLFMLIRQTHGAADAAPMGKTHSDNVFCTRVPASSYQGQPMESVPQTRPFPYIARSAMTGLYEVTLVDTSQTWPTVSA